MKLKNLTAYDVTIITSHGPVTIPYSGLVAEPGRVGYDVETIQVGRGRIRIVRARRYGPLEVPPSEEGTLYIVPRDVYAIYGASRPDLVAPDTGPTAIRDAEGRIVAVRQLLGGAAEPLARALSQFGQ